MEQENSNQQKIYLERYGNSRRIGSIYDKNGKKQYSLQDIFYLIQNKKAFSIFHKSKDITNEVSSKAIKKYWSEEEIKLLKENFGSITTINLRKNFLPAKSISQIQWQADKLSLTIDRRWQTHEINAMTAMRKSGVSFLQISKILQRPIHACQMKADKLGIAYVAKKLNDFEKVESNLEKYLQVPSITKGKIAEDLTSIKLSQNGFDVFIPYTPNHQTDLMVVKDTKVAKLQIKSCSWDRKTERFRVPLVRKNGRNNERKFYEEKDIDFFVLYCLGVDAIYIVPFDVCKKHKGANLYPHRPKLIFDGKFDWEQYRDSFSLIEQFLDKK